MPEIVVGTKDQIKTKDIHHVKKKDIQEDTFWIKKQTKTFWPLHTWGKYFETTVKFFLKIQWEIWQPKFVPTTNIFKNCCNVGPLPER